MPPTQPDPVFSQFEFPLIYRIPFCGGWAFLFDAVVPTATLIAEGVPLHDWVTVLCADCNMELAVPEDKWWRRIGSPRKRPLVICGECFRRHNLHILTWQRWSINQTGLPLIRQE
jgi:hypothetical protein